MAPLAAEGVEAAVDAVAPMAPQGAHGRQGAAQAAVAAAPAVHATHGHVPRRHVGGRSIQEATSVVDEQGGVPGEGELRVGEGGVRVVVAAGRAGAQRSGQQRGGQLVRVVRRVQRLLVGRHGHRVLRLRVLLLLVLLPPRQRPVPAVIVAARPRRRHIVRSPASTAPSL